MTVINIPDTPTEPRRDRWGRYLVVPPEGGKPAGYSRATTIAKALDDTSSLMNWGKRMVALGLVKRPDILAMVAATDPDDRRALDGHCERAAEAGGATVRRDLGTAIHKLVERKIADPTWTVPDLYAADVAAIIAVVDAAGFDIVVEYSEIVVVLDRYQIGGTADLILRRRADGALVVADIKTGSSVKYGALAWAIQLAIYAGADAIYTQGEARNGSDDVRSPMPEGIDRTTGLILHCEPNSGRCDVYSLDIARGAQALDVAMAVRTWRKEKDLLTPHDPVLPVVEEREAAPPAPDTGTSGVADSSPVVATSDIHALRTDWVLRRIETIREAGHTQTLGRSWPKDGLAKPGDVRKGNATWTPDDLTAVIALVDACEARWEMPFSETDPLVDHERAQAEAAKPAKKSKPRKLKASKEDTDYVSDDQVNELRRILAGLDTGPKTVVLAWSRQAQDAGTGWNMGGPGVLTGVSTRRWSIAACALSLVDWLDLDGDDPEELIRAGLRYVTGKPDDGHPVGALLGTLTVDQATQLASALETARVDIDPDGTLQLNAAA